MGRYEDVFRAAAEDPETFWLRAAQAVDWEAAPTRALDSSRAPFHRWYPDGRLNVCFNAVDRHVEAGRGEQPALVYDSPVTGTRRTYTYARLRDEVAAFAGALTGLGVSHGDRVVIYLPMIPEAAVAMLACARIGAIHSVVFGGFAPPELAVRIDDAAPKVVVSASCGIEGKRVIPYKPLLDQAIELAAHRPEKRVIVQRPQERAELGPDDLDWADLVATAPAAPCVPVAATDPLYILYTSGTTGKPKGVVRDCGGYAVALLWSMGAVYDIGPGETMFTGSDVGWVVGHSYIVYGPLLAGATTVLYEGKPVGTPDAGQFWRVAAEYGVKTMFTAPTAFRAIRKEDPKGTLTAGYDLSRLRYLFLAGERLDPETYHWASALLDIPVIDHWWQTETGWPIVANPVGIEAAPVKPGSPTRPLPGWDVRVLDPSGQPVPPGVDGAIVVRLPLPPGALPTLWNDDARFVASYLSAYDGYYLTGDSGHIDEDGYVYVMGRTDDVINVAGHRLSTGSMEEVLATHPDVAECAVIGVADALKGQVPRGLVVLKAGTAREPAEVEAELVRLVRTRIGAVASLKEVAVVPALPKTRSGKILRKTMRGIADGLDEPIPSTVDDPNVIETLRPVLRRPERDGS
ncbi:propionyl-CoA synthetase [Streptomyces griseorubiginosus]|uniref:propionyl-CoA synthetase n=1 Tax=Streptomyces griseorubiginosus TaxID=67304 RepID=UPI001AD7D040|nr:propionyl-CoA synthetase [Streptomyces griseorubiginosus]MBO4252731.1 AMP-binding protein [Streptomyces griseorubiginosus]